MTNPNRRHLRTRNGARTAGAPKPLRLWITGRDGRVVVPISRERLQSRGVEFDAEGCWYVTRDGKTKRIALELVAELLGLETRELEEWMQAVRDLEQRKMPPRPSTLSGMPYPGSTSVPGRQTAPAHALVHGVGAKYDSRLWRSDVKKHSAARSPVSATELAIMTGMRFLAPGQWRCNIPRIKDTLPPVISSSQAAKLLRVQLADLLAWEQLRDAGDRASEAAMRMYDAHLQRSERKRPRHRRAYQPDRIPGDGIPIVEMPKLDHWVNKRAGR